MNKTIITTILIALMSAGMVIADYGSCTDQEVLLFSNCVGYSVFDLFWFEMSYCQWTADINCDGVVNLSDVALFAQSCYGG